MFHVDMFVDCSFTVPLRVIKINGSFIVEFNGLWTATLVISHEIA